MSGAVSTIVNNDIELIKKAKKKLMEASDAYNYPNWIPYADNDQIKVYTEKGVRNGCCSVCGTSIVHAAPEDIVRAIRRPSNWGRMDNMLEKSDHIDISENQRIVHLMFHGFMSIFSKRDIVFLETVCKNKDGSLMIVSTNTGVNCYPESNEYVRTEIKNGGWYIQPFERNKCVVTYYTNLDLKIDSIPPTIMNIFAAKIPSVINRIGELIQ